MSPLSDELKFHSPAPLIDIGANLTHESFKRDLEQVLARAYTAGVQTLIMTGTDQRSIEDTLALITNPPQSEHPLPALFATAGVHPHNASEWDRQLTSLVQDALGQAQVVAVGECGLDFNRDFSPRDAQQKALEAQLELAASTGLPLFLHERDASQRMVEILHDWRDSLSDVVIHCFTGERKTLYRYLDLDLHIGITGWLCDERRGQEVRESVKDIPLHRLMIETDCPYLLPRNLPGKVTGRRHEPALLPWICREIAMLRNVDESVIAQATTATANAFFRLPSLSEHA